MTSESRAPLPVIAEDEGIASVSSNASPFSRRRFLSASASAVVLSALASACGGSGDGPTQVTLTPTRPPSTPPAPPSGSFTFANGVLSVNLDQAPALTATNGFLIASATSGGTRADVVVINLGADGYRAFSSICTHEACTVSDYVNGRIRCPCHLSEFDRTGRNVSGPAPSPLREYGTALNAASRTLAVTIA